MFVATYYTVNKYLTLKDNPDRNGDIEFSTSLLVVDYYKNLSKTWLALGESIFTTKVAYIIIM